ncbi:MAG TPA: protein-disulfide reductase DsbD domain-containing protein [Candidatus Acidoferrum sp.]|nr:protein-disulfide reductase DsbD domain-containing protein [Candidatus Acidoferrum sp.]
MKLIATIFCGILLLAIVAALPSASQVPNPKDVVSPTAYASLDPVGRGSAFQIAVLVKIRNGFHINAREKSEEYLIATDLQAAAPAGFKIGPVSYPKGQLHSFSFSKTPLNVYEGTIELRVAAEAHSNAPLGEQHIPLKLHYQACNDELCLPPVTLDVDARVNVASEASASRPAHAELFRH